MSEAFRDLPADLRYGLRRLRRTPVFTAAAVATLALGIGATAALYSVVHAVLLTPLPYDAPERLVMLRESTNISPLIPMSAPEVDHLRRESTTCQDIAALDLVAFALSQDGAAEEVPGALVSEGFFTMLGTRPHLGRFLEEQEDSDTVPVVLSYGLWQGRFGGDPKVLGLPLEMYWNASFGPDRELGTSFTVVGVLPQSFSSPMGSPDLWAPLPRNPERTLADGHHLFPFARLAEGATVDGAQEELSSLLADLGAGQRVHQGELGATVVPLPERDVARIRPALLALAGAALLVLLIACANVASLLLARSIARRSELALRASLGASRSRLARQLGVESLLVAVFGSVLGLALAQGGISILRTLAPASLPRVEEIRIGGAVLAFTAITCLATTLLCGLWPALRQTRPRWLSGLRTGALGDSDRRGGRSFLVVAEVAMAVMLLVGTGLLLRSFDRLLQVDPGFQADRLLTFRISLPILRYPEGEQRKLFFQQSLERLEQLPGVSSVAAANSIPRLPLNFAINFSVEGREQAEDKPLSAAFRQVSTGYFETLGVGVSRGRPFEDRDFEGPPRTAIINQALADAVWPGADPLGQRLTPAFPNAEAVTIIGVAGNVRQLGPSRDPGPCLYLPRISGRARHFVLRATVPPADLGPLIRREIAALDPAQPVSNLSTMGELLDGWVSRERFRSRLLVLFASLALGLAAVGTYGVLNDSVGRRTRELGLRAALGARRGQLVSLVLGQGLRLVLLGLALGVLGSAFLSRFLESQLFGITPWDPASYGAMIFALLLVATAAISIPAYHAGKVDPMEALRQES